jgi:hypothetical protein
LEKLEEIKDTKRHQQKPSQGVSDGMKGVDLLLDEKDVCSSDQRIDPNEMKDDRFYHRLLDNPVQDEKIKTVLKDGENIQYGNIMDTHSGKVIAQTHQYGYDSEKDREEPEIEIGWPLPIKGKAGQQGQENNKKTKKIEHLLAK